MSAALAQLAFVHNENGVGALDGGETVRDEDGGAAGDHAGERETDAEFGVGINGGGSFVEDEDAGIVGEGAGEANELLLTGRESCAAFAYWFGKLEGESPDEIADVDFVAGPLEALVGDP